MQQNQSTPSFDLDAAGDTFWSVLWGSVAGLALTVAGLAIGIGLSGTAGNTKSFWYLSRSSGMVAYLLLWGSVVWGLLLTSKVVHQRTLRPATIFSAHQFLSNIAIGFALFHGVILIGDHYLSLPLSAILIPFAGDYKPLLVALGQLGLWLSLLLIISFYLRRWTGQKLWRWFHYSSFIAYWLVLFHALLMGTDSTSLWAHLLYGVTFGVVLFLTMYRALTAHENTKTRRPSSRVNSTSEVRP